ncbi:8-amino-7-oxononanoate synthase [Thiomicrorhabdus xiamenensis]|uniref:8-amino-7-oxononanoate synthase n=1 Tax=Thiomicrorhabdus xiamenensis TaxID=2739063 RepID=A0A7D4NWZ6_9GAMM|nr:8-amino-7-oxononanoate synthase [Thiomicrorhabdus xiamenensis]QKI88238.1 8-amino-7-oxononanoate synthase [Thiomicrorhabdus xiamenensis]
MAIETIQQRFSDRLKTRRSEHLYRQRPLAFGPQQPQMQINGLCCINFCSNDYLGLANHPQIKQRLIAALQNDDISYGSGAAHLVTGHHLEHHLLEDELADWLGVERVLLFSTGFMANLAVLETFAQKGDVILGDKLNHASLVDGALHSEAEFKRYPHGDMTALEKRLQQAQAKEQQAVIVTDGVFSMDGDLAPLPEIQELARKYHAWLIIDDAHGFGALGQEGKGTLNHFNLETDCNTLQIGTLGKAFGCSGAFVAGSETAIEALIQFARPYIYTTASPQLNAVAVRQALRLVKSADKERRHLQELIQQFRQGAQQIGLKLWSSPTAIQPVMLGASETAMRWSEELKQKGFWVAAIRPPTVPQNQARLRITFSASHTVEEVDALLQALDEIHRQESSAKV